MKTLIIIVLCVVGFGRITLGLGYEVDSNGLGSETNLILGAALFFAAFLFARSGRKSPSRK